VDDADAVARNRRAWNRFAADYQARHGAVLDATALAWGCWRLPESELRILGDLEALRGRRVLELGCGAAPWSLALRRRGVDVVGMDLSEAQLSHARQAARERGSELPLVHADAERLPFGDERFDLVFCDHGATSFTRPERSVPEAARVLRPGGRLAFCMSTPLRDCCIDPDRDVVTPTLYVDYFGLHALEDEADGSVCYQLPYGAWIRLFRSSGLEVEDLVELRPPEGAGTSYEDYAPLAWARRWPAEHVWKLVKRDAARSRGA